MRHDHDQSDNPPWAFSVSWTTPGTMSVLSSTRRSPKENLSVVIHASTPQASRSQRPTSWTGFCPIRVMTQPLWQSETVRRMTETMLIKCNWFMNDAWRKKSAYSRTRTRSHRGRSPRELISGKDENIYLRWITALQSLNYLINLSRLKWIFFLIIEFLGRAALFPVRKSPDGSIRKGHRISSRNSMPFRSNWRIADHLLWAGTASFTNLKNYTLKQDKETEHKPGGNALPIGLSKSRGYDNIADRF